MNDAKTLRIEKRKNESADMFVMRAFAMALPHMDDNALNAAVGWMHSKAQEILTKNRIADFNRRFGKKGH